MIWYLCLCGNVIDRKFKSYVNLFEEYILFIKSFLIILNGIYNNNGDVCVYFKKYEDDF